MEARPAPTEVVEPTPAERVRAAAQFVARLLSPLPAQAPLHMSEHYVPEHFK